MVFGELLVPAPVRSDSPRDWVDGVVQEIAVLRGWRSDAQGGRTVTVSFHDDASTADTTVGEGEEGRVPLAGAAAGAAHMLRSLVDEAAACALEASASVCTRVRAQGREDLSKESLQEDTEAIVATYVEFLRLRERENMAALLGTAAQPPPTTSGGMASGRGAATGSSSEEQLRTAVYQAQQTVHKLRQQGRYKEASELESELVEAHMRPACSRHRIVRCSRTARTRRWRRASMTRMRSCATWSSTLGSRVLDIDVCVATLPGGSLVLRPLTRLSS